MPLLRAATLKSQLSQVSRFSRPGIPLHGAPGFAPVFWALTWAQRSAGGVRTSRSPAEIVAKTRITSYDKRG